MRWRWSPEGRGRHLPWPMGHPTALGLLHRHQRTCGGRRSPPAVVAVAALLPLSHPPVALLLLLLRSLLHTQAQTQQLARL